MFCRPICKTNAAIFFVLLVTLVLSLRVFNENLITHNHTPNINAPLDDYGSQNFIFEVAKEFPSPISDAHLEKYPIFRNCSASSIPNDWQSSNLTLEQLGQSIEMKDCTNFDDIEKILSHRTEIMKKECEALGSEERDLFRSQWTWQAIGPNGNGIRFLDDTKNYRMCINPKAGSSSWRSHTSIIKKEHIQTTDVVYIFPARHPFARLMSAYNDKFCMGYIFTCYFSKRSPSGFDEMYIYGMWIPLLISSGKIDVDKDFYVNLSNAVALKGQGRHYVGNPEIERIIQEKYSNSTKEILEKFKGIFIPFEEFVNHIFWTYRNDVADHHWIPQTTLCNACKIPWSYILHLENNEVESKYILEKLGFKNTRMVSKKNVHYTEETPDYLKIFYELPMNLIVKLVKYYYFDFLLLDYSL